MEPSRPAALERLEVFLPQVPRYGRERTFDRPGNQAVSSLSPFIRLRLLQEKEVVRRLVEALSFRQAGPFIRQVCWRTYWKGYLELRPDIWRQYRAFVADPSRFTSEFEAERLARALEGRTGIECFDAWVRQLTRTGWLHNHARMWFASIWIFTLKLPWQLGAAFFLKHLLDGDPASNTLSWRWVAGLHTPGKIYLAREDNIRTYTRGQFFPEGQLAAEGRPVESDGDFPAGQLPPTTAINNMHFPSLSSCPAGLLVTAEDLTPEIGELGETPFSSICSLWPEDTAEAIGASERVRAFQQGAFADTASRLALHWNGSLLDCHEAVIPCVGKASSTHVGRRERMRVYAGTVREWVPSVVTWALNENLKSVWMLEPPVGPWRDALAQLGGELDAHGIRLETFRRRWDQAHWPHAGRGYFPFARDLESRIASLLKRPASQ